MFLGRDFIRSVFYIQCYFSWTGVFILLSKIFQIIFIFFVNGERGPPLLAAISGCCFTLGFFETEAPDLTGPMTTGLTHWVVFGQQSLSVDSMAEMEEGASVAALAGWLPKVVGGEEATGASSSGWIQDKRALLHKSCTHLAIVCEPLSGVLYFPSLCCN